MLLTVHSIVTERYKLQSCTFIKNYASNDKVERYM